MSFLKKITPTFWNHRELGWNTDVEIYVYRRKWMMLILFISVLTFIPLGILTAIFYQMSSEEILNELNEETKINSENAALELNLPIKKLYSLFSRSSKKVTKDSLSWMYWTNREKS